MKKIVTLLLLSAAVCANAQLGGLIGAASQKISGGGKSKTDGITSPMHQKYMNRIVFAASDERMQKGKEDESAFIDKFTLGEPVVFRVYMDNSLVNYLKGKKFPETHGYYTVRFWLDGIIAYEGKLQEEEFSRDEKREWTTWRGAFKSPDGEPFLGTNLFNNFVSENEAKLTKGDHKLKLEILPATNYTSPYTGPVVASGEISMTVANTVADPNDAKACMPKALMADKALEAKILAAFKAQGWKETPKEVRITSSKWTIVRNNITGVILSRYVEATIGSALDGKCIMQPFGFYQDHDGSAFQDEVYLKGVGSQRNISCACLKL